jgi:uncharacterized protein (TIGR02246 family)
MRVQRVLGVTVASAALAITAIAGAPSAQADDGYHHQHHRCNHQYSEKPTCRQIAVLFDRWNAALATGDAHRVADLYAPNGVLLPTRSARIHIGRTAIANYFEHFLESKPVARIQERFIDVLGPTSAIDTGLYRFTLTNEDGSKTKVDARYTFLYELRAGRWLIINHHSSVIPTGSLEDGVHYLQAQIG